MAIITTAEYQAWAGIPVASSARIDSIVAAVQAQLERYCNRVFDRATFAEITNGTGTNQVIARNTPIVELNSVQLVNPISQPSAPAVLFTFPANAYTWDADTGIVTLAPLAALQTVYRPDWGDGNYFPMNSMYGTAPMFPRGVRNVLINYRGGYDATFPDDLKMVMYRLVAIELANAGNDVSLAAEQDGEYSYQRSPSGDALSLANAMRTLAAPWRRFVK